MASRGSPSGGPAGAPHAFQPRPRAGSAGGSGNAAEKETEEDDPETRVESIRIGHAPRLMRLIEHGHEAFRKTDYHRSLETWQEAIPQDHVNERAWPSKGSRSRSRPDPHLHKLFTDSSNGGSASEGSSDGWSTSDKSSKGARERQDAPPVVCAPPLRHIIKPSSDSGTPRSDAASSCAWAELSADRGPRSNWSDMTDNDNEDDAVPDERASCRTIEDELQVVATSVALEADAFPIIVANVEAVTEVNKKKKKKPVNRQRPPKPQRVQAKRLALMLFEAQTDEDKETAEMAFMEEAENDSLVYDYAMLVLQCLRESKKSEGLS